MHGHQPAVAGLAGPFLERLLDVLYLPLLACSEPTLVALQPEV